MRFRNYRNKYTKNKIIRSLEDIIDMPFGNIVDMEQELYNQYNQIGLPTNEELKSSPNVRFIESSINDEGIKIPSRWEAFNPMENVTQKAIMENSSAKPFENLTIDNYGNETNIPQKFETKQSLWKKLAKGLSAITPFADDTTDMEMQEITPVLKQQTQNIQTNIPQVQQVTPLLAKDMNTDISENLNQEMEENVPIVQNPAINLQEDFSKELTTFPNIDNSKVQLSENVQEFINSLLESKKNRADVVKNPHEKISDTSEQQGQSQLSNNLKDYINELVGENIDYGFIGNEASTSSQPEIPIYPENGVIKGQISNTDEDNINSGKKFSDELLTIFNDYKGLKDPKNTALYVLGDFLTNYFELKDANTIGADKYFHARANYESAQQGIVGSLVAKLISDLRENSDSYRNIHEKGYTPEISKKDIEEDQKANEEGRLLGRENPLTDAYELLKYLMPKGFPERYKRR